MTEDQEKIITNPFIVLEVIKFINSNFAPIIKNLCPTCPHRDGSYYFVNGSCATYAEILHSVFEGVSQYYSCANHVVTKIGNLYYDAQGLNYAPLETDEYKFCPEEYFPEVKLGLHRTDGTEELIKDPLIEIGKTALEKFLRKKGIDTNSLKLLKKK